MNKQELTEAFLDALRAFAVEQAAQKEAAKEARKAKRIKDDGIKPPKLARQAIALLQRFGGMTESQWRNAIMLEYGRTNHAVRVFWHRYGNRMLAEGWVTKDENDVFYASQTLQNSVP